MRIAIGLQRTRKLVSRIVWVISGVWLNRVSLTADLGRCSIWVVQILPKSTLSEEKDSNMIVVVHRGSRISTLWKPLLRIRRKRWRKEGEKDMEKGKAEPTMDGTLNLLNIRVISCILLWMNLFIGALYRNVHPRLFQKWKPENSFVFVPLMEMTVTIFLPREALSTARLSC